MAFTMTKVSAPNRADFDRVFAECLPYVSHERRSIGDGALKESLWSALNRDGMEAVVYRKDDYVVGMASLSTMVWGGVRYLYHMYPTYGADETGSRAWWYSDDFQRVSADFVRDNNYVGIVTVFNPNTPASNAVKNHFGNIDGNYFERPTEIEVTELFGRDITIKEGVKAFVIMLKEDD